MNLLIIDSTINTVSSKGIQSVKRAHAVVLRLGPVR